MTLKRILEALPERALIDFIQRRPTGAVTREKAAEALEPLRARRTELERILARSPEPPTLLHPSVTLRYRQEVARLTQALQEGSAAAQASAALRSLIDRIELRPHATDDTLVVDLHGDLAGLLAIASGTDREALDMGPAIKLVAEEGLEPPTRGL